MYSIPIMNVIASLVAFLYFWGIGGILLRPMDSKTYVHG